MNDNKPIIPKTMSSVATILLCIGLIAFALGAAFFGLPAKVTYHITERYFFSGTGRNDQVFLGLILPKSGPYQKVDNVDVSWSGKLLREDHGIVEVVKFSAVENRSGELVAKVEYDVQLPQGSVSWSAPVKTFQLLPQMGIESDCECLKSIATSLWEGTTGKDAFEIYTFVAEYLTYSQEYQDCTSLSAAKAYKIGACVCAGYARLMTAFCRASGIPAQVVLGLVYPDPMFKSHITSFPENPAEGHAWVEYYSEEKWKMADPTWAVIYPKFLQFNRNDGRHLVYGELEQILSIDNELENWAIDSVGYVLSDTSSFRYIAVSTSNKITFLAKVTVKRNWDGRWVNTLIVWVVVTWSLCYLRRRMIG